MCEPVSIALASAALVGSAMTAYSQVRAGNAKKAMADRQAQMASSAAGDAMVRGQQQAAQIATKGGQVQGQQTVALAASGLDISSGSPLELLSRTKEYSTLDVRTALNNAAREAYGYQTQGQMVQFQGEQAQTEGYLSGGGTLLGGAAKAFEMGYGTYLSSKRPQIPGSLVQ